MSYNDASYCGQTKESETWSKLPESRSQNTGLISVYRNFVLKFLFILISYNHPNGRFVCVCLLFVLFSFSFYFNCLVCCMVLIFCFVFFSFGVCFKLKPGMHISTILDEKEPKTELAVSDLFYIKYANTWT